MTDVLRRVMTKYVADATDHIDEAKRLARAVDTISFSLEKQETALDRAKKSFAELAKGQAQAQLGRYAQEAAAGVDKLTGGVFNLGDAALGMQIFGPVGGLVAGFGRAALEAASSLGAFHSEIEELERRQKAQREEAQKQLAQLASAPVAVLKVVDAFAHQRKVVEEARQTLASYNGTLHQVELGLDALSKKAPDAIATLLGGLVGYDPWNPDKTKKKLDRIFKPGSGERIDARAAHGTYESGAPPGYYAYVDHGLGQKADSEYRDDYGRGIDLGKLAQQNLTDKYTKNWFELSDKLGARGDQPTVVEQMFGKIEEINAYHEAFSLLAGTATSAYDALVEGNKSAGAAVKAFIKDALKGLGARMLIRSLEETAEGVSALSNPFTAVSAATRFKSAALFAAGAVAAGVVASSLGGGGGGGGGGHTASTAYKTPGGLDGYQGGKSPVIVIGDSFAQDSPRARQRAAKRIVAAAGLNTSAGEDN